MENVLIVMPFMEDWSQAVWDNLEGIVARDPNRRINVTRVDLNSTAEEWLAEHIEGVNRGAQVVVADLTNNNPNVLIEVGLALASDTPLLLITQDFSSVPAHLGGRIVETYDPSDKDSLDRLQSTLYFRLRETLKYLEAHQAKNLLKSPYDVKCFSNRREVLLENYFRVAKNRIDILTTNLSFLFEAYGETEAKYFDEIQTALDRPKSRVKIRILTLDPESDFAAKRGRQLGFAPRVFRDTLRDALASTHEIAEKYETARFEVRTYDDFPNQIMYRLDDHIFHCVVAQPTQSRRHLTFKLNRRHAGVDTSFTEHFQYVWSRAT